MPPSNKVKLQKNTNLNTQRPQWKAVSNEAVFPLSAGVWNKRCIYVCQLLFVNKLKLVVVSEMQLIDKFTSIA